MRFGFLIMQVGSPAAVEAFVKADPFAVEELIVSLVIEGWDPLFGVFAADSTGELAGVGPVG